MSMDTKGRHRDQSPHSENQSTEKNRPWVVNGKEQIPSEFKSRLTDKNSKKAKSGAGKNQGLGDQHSESGRSENERIPQVIGELIAEAVAQLESQRIG